MPLYAASRTRRSSHSASPTDSSSPSIPKIATPPASRTPSAPGMSALPSASGCEIASMMNASRHEIGYYSRSAKTLTSTVPSSQPRKCSPVVIAKSPPRAR